MAHNQKRTAQPAIRFKGFDEDWVETPLKEVFYNIRNAFVGTATPYYVKKGHFYLESNNVKNGAINKNNQVFINDDFYYKQKDKWLKSGDIVMVQSGHVGHSAVIPPELNNSAAHALIMFTDYKIETNPYFLNYQFLTHKSKNQIDRVTTGNTIKHILSSDMKEFTLYLTKYEEQTAIGNLFQQLDNSLNLYKQKQAKTQQFKSAMLTKMFPQQGQSQPEIRLKGFSGDWNKKKLEDVADFSKGKSLSKKDMKSGNNPCIHYGELFTDYGRCITSIYSYTHLHPRDMILSKVNDVLMPTSDVTPSGLAKASALDFENIILGGDILIIRFKHELNKFFAYFVEGHQKEVINLTTGTTVYHLYAKDLKGFELLFPNIEEQTAIGNFFKQLDDTLALYSRQIATLEKLKKALLAKMFV